MGWDKYFLHPVHPVWSSTKNTPSIAVLARTHWFIRKTASLWLIDRSAPIPRARWEHSSTAAVGGCGLPSLPQERSVPPAFFLPHGILSSSVKILLWWMHPFIFNFVCDPHPLLLMLSTKYHVLVLYILVNTWQCTAATTAPRLLGKNTSYTGDCISLVITYYITLCPVIAYFTFLSLRGYCHQKLAQSASSVHVL